MIWRISTGYRGQFPPQSSTSADNMHLGLDNSDNIATVIYSHPLYMSCSAISLVYPYTAYINPYKMSTQTTEQNKMANRFFSQELKNFIYLLKIV